MYEFEKKLEHFNSFYLWLVIGVGTMMIAAIVSAIYISVLLGVFICICACLAYLFFLSDELKRRLGLKHKRVDGGLSLSVVSGKETHGDAIPEIHIPARLMWLDVVRLSSNAGQRGTAPDVQVVYLPRSVRKIEKDALSALPMLYRVVYEGTAEEWEKICKEDVLDRLEIIFSNQNTQEV